MGITKREISSIDDLQSVFPVLRDTYHQCSAYTLTNLEYRKVISEAHGHACSNKSYLVSIDNNPVFAFIGGISEKKKMINLDSFAGRPCIAVIDYDKVTSKLSTYFFSELEDLLNTVNGIFHFRDPLVYGKISPITRYLLSQGSNVTQFFTQVIDLEVEEMELKKAIRKSFKSLINWGKRELTITTHTSENILISDIKAYKDLHYIESGKVTRADDSWEVQHKMIKNDNAFLVSAQYGSELVAVGFFTINSNSCYYGSSASRRDLFDKPLFHSIMWEALMYARKRKCKWFEVGEQTFTGSTKEQGISLFKSGFGGVTKVYLDLKYSKSQ